MACQLIDEFTAHGQSDNLEDAREICADGTYFPNNLRMLVHTHTHTHIYIYIYIYIPYNSDEVHYDKELTPRSKVFLEQTHIC